MSESSFQISEKLTDTAIFVVRGADYVDFSNNIAAVADDKEFRDDVGRFIRAVTGNDMVSQQQAVATVQNSFPGAQPVQQAQPQQHTNEQTFSCQHGQRQHKEGRKKNGGTWTAYFCPSKQCKPMNADGSLWTS